MGILGKNRSSIMVPISVAHLCDKGLLHVRDKGLQPLVFGQPRTGLVCHAG